MSSLNYTPEIKPIKKTDQRSEADKIYESIYRQSFIGKAKEEAEVKRQTDRANTLRGIVYSPVETKMGAIANTVKQNKINMLRNSTPEVKNELKQQSDSLLIQSGVIPREPQETKKLGFWEGLDKISPPRITPGLGQAIELKEATELGLAAGKLYNGNASEKDLLLLDKFITELEADKTLSYNVLSGLHDTILLAEELVFTSGIATAGRKAAKEGLEVLGKKLLTTAGKKKLAKAMAKKGLKRSAIKMSERIATGLAGEVLRSPVAGALRIPTKTIEKQAIDKIRKVGTDEKLESIALSLTKAYGESLTELISERSGGMIGSGVNYIGKQIGIPAVKNYILKGGIIRALAKANPTKRLDDIGRFVNSAGFNGVLNESLEERVGDILQGGLYEVGLGDNKFALPDKEQILTEIILFSILGMSYATAGKVSDVMEGKRVEPSPELELAFRKDPVEMAKENITSPTTQQAIDQVGLTREVAENAPIVNTAKPINPVKANVKNILQKAGKLSPVRVNDVKTDKTTRTTEKPLTEAPVASGEATSKPITVYRGEGKGIGNATLVKGEYFADSKDFASTFGKVKKSEIPAGSKIFNLDNVKEGNGEIPSEMLVDQDKLTEYLIDKGYDYTVNTNTRGTEYVKLNKTENKLKKLARSSKSKAEFTKKVVENWDEYREEIDRLSPDQSRANMPGYKSGTDIIWDKYGTKTSKKTMPVKANVSNILKEVKKERAKKTRIKKTKETKEKKSKEKKVEEVKEGLTELITSENYDRLSPEGKKKALREKLNSKMNKSAEEKTGVRIEEPSKSDKKKYNREEEIMNSAPKNAKTPSQIRAEYRDAVAVIEKEKASEVDRMEAEEKRRELASEYHELTGNWISDEIGGKNDYIGESDDMDEGSVELIPEWFGEEEIDLGMSERLYRKGKKDLNKNEVEELIGESRTMEMEKNLNDVKEKSDRINSGKEKFNLSDIVFGIAKKYKVIVQDQVGDVPYWERGRVAISDRTNLVSFTHEIAHEMFYRDIQGKLGKDQYDFSGPLYDEITSIGFEKLTREESQALSERTLSSNANIRKAACTDLMSEAYSYMAEMVVKNNSEAKAMFPNAYEAFYVDKNSVFYSKDMIDIIKDINFNLKVYRNLNTVKQGNAHHASNNEKKQNISTGLLNKSQRLTNRVRDAGVAVRALDKMISRARGVKANVRDIFIKNGSVSLEKIFSMSRPTSERAVSNIMGGGGVYKLDPIKGDLVKMSDVNYSEMVEDVEKRGLTDELGTVILARNTVYEYETYKKTLPLLVTKNNKRIKKLEGEIEAIEVDDSLNEIEREEKIENRNKAIRELKAEIADIKKTMARIKRNVRSMPLVRKNQIFNKSGLPVRNKKGEYVVVTDITDASNLYESHKDKYKKELEIFDEINRVNLDLAYESGELSDAEYEIYSSKKGYSPVFREVLKTSGGAFSGGIKTNLIALKTKQGRDGSIYNPLVVLPYLHIQSMQGYNKNIFLSELYNAKDLVPSIIHSGKSGGKMSVKIKGERKQFDVLDKDLHESIEAEYGQLIEYSTLNKFLAGHSRLFVSMTTGRNPGFALKNIFIDLPTSFVFSKTGYIPLVSQSRMVARVASSNQEMDSFKQYWNEYNSLGGYKSHWSNVNFDKVKPEDIINLLSKKGKAYQQAKEKVGDALGALPAFTEALTRFTEYYRSRRFKGLDVVESFENARNVAGSFHKKGASTSMRKFVRVSAYFNSSAQIMFEFAKQMTSKKGATRMAQMTLFYTLIQVAQAIRMRRDYEEAITDEEKEKAMLRINKYLDRSAFGKLNFIYSKSGKIKIPSNPLFGGPGAMLATKILAGTNPYYEANYKDMLLEMPSGMAGHRLVETSVSSIASALALPFNIMFNRGEGGEDLVDSFKNLAGSMAGITPSSNTVFALAGYKTFPVFDKMDPYGDNKEYSKDFSKMSILISEGTGIPAKNIEGAVRGALGTLGLNVFDLTGEILMSDEKAGDLILEEPAPIERLLKDQLKSFRGDDLFIARSGEFSVKMFEEKRKLERDISEMNNQRDIIKGRDERGVATPEDIKKYRELKDKLDIEKTKLTRITSALSVRKFIVDYQDGKFYRDDLSSVITPKEFNELYYIFRKISDGKNLTEDEKKLIVGLDNDIRDFKKRIEKE